MSVKNPPTPSRWSELDTCKISPPAITLENALSSWFLYDGRAYRVDRCSQAIFDAFLLACIPDWTERKKREHLVFNAPDDDVLLYRWFNLDVLKVMKVKLMLYGSEQEAKTGRTVILKG